MKKIETLKKFSKNERDYAVLCAKFLISSKFEDVSMGFYDLAKNGDLRSLAKYLYYQRKDMQAESLLKKARAIEKKGARTAEEWEVVAALHGHDDIPVFYTHEILPIHDVVKRMNDSLKVYDYALDEYQHGRMSEDEANDKYLQFRGYYQALINTEYMQAVKFAQLEYYKKFKASGDVLAFSAVTELSGMPYSTINFVLNKSCNIDKYLSSCEKLMKGYKTFEKNLDTVSCYACGMMNYYSRSDRESKKGLYILSKVASVDLPDVRVQSKVLYFSEFKR